MGRLDTSEQIENQRKRLLIITFAVVGCFFLGPFGILSILKGRIYLGTVLLMFMGIVIAIAWNVKKIDQLQPISTFISSILFVLAMYLLTLGGNEGTGAYWTYPIAMLMIFLVGPKVGFYFMAAYILVSMVFLFGNFSFVFDYSAAHKIRIIAATISLLTLVIASEWIRFGSYSAISEISKEHQSRANTDSLTNVLNRHGLQGSLT
ncbi:hypothetical protein [Alteromonas sp. ASW11-130]|uniref:hypothetical protein n=1 Tax=Alteromonas sp. ASW11-130 TaxID=3015775 RepID=UPI002242467B|nr:hypothetical protein [Alteromonas sp. ASW11-130]MCW8091202.1 hypothetical protein [Alteromonas sp. ASW11-130]